MTNGAQPAWFQRTWPLHTALILAVCSWTFFFANPLEPAESRWFDQTLRWRLDAKLARPVDPRILHLDVTDKVVSNLPTLESEYEAVAQWLEEASHLGVDLFVLDVIFHRGTRSMAVPILEAMRKSRGIILAEGLRASPGSGKLEKKLRSFPFLKIRDTPSGVINITADPDGVYRRYSYIHPYRKRFEPSLALAAYLATQGIQWPEDITFSKQGAEWRQISKEGTALVRREIKQSTGTGRPLPDFRSGWTDHGPQAFPHMTPKELHELYQKSKKDPSVRPLAGKIVFIGYVASGVSDFGTTPFGSHQPLVHLHATALNDLFQGTSHFRLPRWMDSLLVLLLFPLALGFKGCRSKKGLGFYGFAGILTLFISGFAACLYSHRVLPTILLVTVWTGTLVAELIRRHSCELMERLRWKTAMSFYFSPRVLKKVLENPGSMEPHQVEMTVLLTDIRNFTPLSEHVGTRGVFSLCNQVFEVQTRAVLEEDGSLEHFLGDQMLAYWGAPEPQRDGADRALRSAIRLMKLMEELRESLTGKVRELFGYGVALHAGLAMIGNKGSSQRMDYGVLGDLINSAARVESLTKYYGVRFLITREAYVKIANPPPSRLLDAILPVGKSVPLEVFEVQHPFSPPHFETVSAEYAQAFQRYRQGNFAQALQQFERLVHEYADPPSQRLAERCQTFLTHPPENWKGIYSFTSK